MRVRLSYTAEVDDVLEEASLLFGNLSTTIQRAIDTYNDITTNLKDDEFNPKIFHEDIDKLRQNLAKIDTRCVELEQIIAGYSDYQRAPQDFSPETLESAPTPEIIDDSSPSVVVVENDMTND